MAMMQSRTGRNLILIVVSLLVGGVAADAREITDMLGRRVTVPEEIRKVYGTSPPATSMVYAVDPGLVAGLNFPVTPSQSRHLDPRMQTLPVIGGWFGQGRSANMETLLTVKPDVILVWWWKGSPVYEKIERTLEPTGIPTVCILLDSLDQYPATFAFLGELLGRRQRTLALGRYAEAVLEASARMRAAIPEQERVSVYYAEEADGLSTECHTSVHAQLIPLSGGENVHRCSQRAIAGREKISMEQVLRYDPQVIVSSEALFFSRLADDVRWRSIRAVRDGRVYRIPDQPFNWFDRPPSFMRLIGLHWTMHRLHPERHPIDLIAETRHFYRLFLNVELDEAAVRKLFEP